MEHYGKLTRQQVLDDLELLAEKPEFICFRDDYMNHAISALDLKLAAAMLRLGANPNLRKPWADGFLHDLFHEFMSARTTKGEAVLAMIRLLLANGADPNLVGGCNFRAVDLAMSAGCTEISSLLVSAGADASPRPFI